MADCLATLLTPDSFWVGLVCPFTNIFGEWFWLLMLFSLEAIIMVKFDNITAPAVFGVLIGTMMIPLLPASVTIIPILILLVNGGAIIYSAVFRGE